MSTIMENELDEIERKVIIKFKSNLLIALVKRFGPEFTISMEEIDNIKGDILTIDAVNNTYILKVENYNGPSRN